jgi:DNA-binding MarR family transcriptional regulator
LKNKKPTFIYSFQDSLGHNLHRIGQLMREETNKALKRFALTPEQWQILVVLSQENGLTPTELGEITLRDKTTISRILPPLFRKGMIVKESNPSDGRSYVIRVDEQVRKLVQETLLAIKEHYQDEVFACLSESEQAQLLQLILKLRGALGDL